MDAQHLLDLLADLPDRIERGRRLLEHHRDPVAPDLAHLFVGQFEQVPAIEQDLAGLGAANAGLIMKTSRGNAQDGVKFNFRSEYGFSDLNSLDYGQPTNHTLQLDETGKRFCVQGAGNVAACSRTMDFMTEILRINNVNADTIRTPSLFQWNAAGSGGELQNVFQANIWPKQYYNSFAQVTSRNATSLAQLDASGRVGGVRYFVSGSFTNDAGAIQGLKGQQQKPGRVNLDYDVRNNLLV